MKEGSARRSFPKRWGLARVVVVSACVFVLLCASTSIVGQAAEDAGGRRWLEPTNSQAGATEDDDRLQDEKTPLTSPETNTLEDDASEMSAETAPPDGSRAVDNTAMQEVEQQTQHDLTAADETTDHTHHKLPQEVEQQTPHDLTAADETTDHTHHKLPPGQEYAAYPPGQGYEQGYEAYPPGQGYGAYGTYAAGFPGYGGHDLGQTGYEGYEGADERTLAARTLAARNLARTLAARNFAARTLAALPPQVIPGPGHPLAAQYQTPLPAQYQTPLAAQYQTPLAAQYQTPLAAQYQTRLPHQVLVAGHSVATDASDHAEGRFKRWFKPSAERKWYHFWRRNPSPKVNASSVKAFLKSMSGKDAGLCGMYAITGQYTIQGMNLPMGDWIAGNFAAAKKAVVRLPRHSGLFGKILPKTKVPTCSSDDDLLRGFKAAAQNAPGLEDGVTKAGFEATVRAVIRYKTTNLVKRQWLCHKQPAPSRQCSKESEAFQLLLYPLRGFMCSKDLYSICGSWGREAELDEMNKIKLT